MTQESTKKIVYIDMDNVMVDFESGIEVLEREHPELHAKHLVGENGKPNFDEAPHIFGMMKPVEGAIDAFLELSKHFDVYLLSTAPWKNPTAWHDKVEWVHKNFGLQDGNAAHKRLIISHHKHLNRGHFLIDDREANGAGMFAEANADLGAEHIWFGPKGVEKNCPGNFPDWQSVLEYLIPKA